MARIAFLILAHNHQVQVVRLIETIKRMSPEALVFLHYDSTRSKQDFNSQSVSQFSTVYVLPSAVPVEWGRFSVVEAILYGIDYIMKHQIHYDWLVVLSGQCYPIQPLSIIEKFYDGTDYDALIDTFPIASPSATSYLSWNPTTGEKRFHYHFYDIPLGSWKPIRSCIYHLSRLAAELRSISLVQEPQAQVGLRCHCRLFSTDFQCFAGSMWFSLSRECVAYVQQFIQGNPEFVAHYRRTYVPDESFFQTIIANAKHFKVSSDNKRFEIWTGGAHPKVLTRDDFQQISSCGKHFARKFDLADPQLLNMIDSLLLSRST